MKQKNKDPESFDMKAYLKDERKKWDSLTGLQRARYLWDYYKLPFVIACIIIYIICFSIFLRLSKKNTILYAGLINIAPTEETMQMLSDDFLKYVGKTDPKDAFRLYTGWYLTTNKDSQHFEYTYASQLKILAAIDDEQLDVVLMDRESFDAFSQNGYLYNVDTLLKDTPIYEQLKPYMITNIEFLEDNAKDINFDTSIEFKSTSQEYPMGLELSDSSVLAGTHYSDTIYLGVIANTPRTDTVVQYISYLFPESALQDIIH